jgi:hypothetical protein
MTTAQHETPVLSQRRVLSQILVREMWASLAIVVMWLAVVVDAIVGPDIVSTGVAGDHTTVPSAVAVALFAFLGTWVVARYGFRERHD